MEFTLWPPNNAKIDGTVTERETWGYICQRKTWSIIFPFHSLTCIKGRVSYFILGFNPFGCDTIGDQTVLTSLSSDTRAAYGFIIRSHFERTLNVKVQSQRANKEALYHNTRPPMVDIVRINILRFKLGGFKLCSNMIHVNILLLILLTTQEWCCCVKTNNSIHHAISSSSSSP